MTVKLLRAVVVAAVVLAPAAGWAEFRRVELKIAGMDWATCAHAVRVAIGRLEGVESVEVSLERRVADIRLASGNRITLARLRQIVKDNAFNPHEAAVTVVGLLVRRGALPSLAVSGTDVTLALAADPSQPAPFATAVSRLNTPAAVTIEGTVRAAADAKQPDQLLVRVVR